MGGARRVANDERHIAGEQSYRRRQKPGLDVGSTMAATNLGLQFRNSYSLVLSSYHDGELSRFGPGRGDQRLRRARLPHRARRPSPLPGVRGEQSGRILVRHRICAHAGRRARNGETRLRRSRARGHLPRNEGRLQLRLHDGGSQELC